MNNLNGISTSSTEIPDAAVDNSRGRTAGKAVVARAIAAGLYETHVAIDARGLKEDFTGTPSTSHEDMRPFRASHYQIDSAARASMSSEAAAGQQGHHVEMPVPAQPAFKPPVGPK